MAQFTEKYFEILETKLRSSLDKVEVDDKAWFDPDEIYNKAESFSLELHKSKKEYLGKFDGLSIVYEFIADEYDYEYLKDKTGKIKDFDQQKYDDLIKKILEYCIAIPTSYQVIADLGKQRDKPFDEIDVASGIKLVYLEPGNLLLNKKLNISGTYIGQTSLNEKSVQLIAEGSGYLSSLPKHDLFLELSAKMKMVFYLGILYKAFDESGHFAWGRRGKSDLFYIEESSSKYLKKMDINSEFSEHLYKIRLNKELKEKIKPGFLGSALRPDINGCDEAEYLSWEETNKDFLDKARRLLESKSKSKASPIQRAVVWAYNSRSAQDVNMSFIQGCMAFEALLGDNLSSQQRLHETLADRFSYLIGTNNENRKTFRKNFKEVYDIRSGIVHGKETHISHTKAYLQGWLQNVLEYCIKKELRHI